MAPVSDGELKLAQTDDLTTENSGRLLIYNGEDKEWQSIYDDGWGGVESQDSPLSR